MKLTIIFLLIRAAAAATSSLRASSDPDTKHDAIGGFHVKLVPGKKQEDLESKYPSHTVAPLFSLSKKQLQELRAAKSGLPDLTLWYRVTAPAKAVAALILEEDIAAFEEDVASSMRMDDIISDVVIPKIAPRPQARVRARALDKSPDFFPKQGYLKPNSESNNGIDAEYSWKFDGGNGEGVTIYDVEASWNQLHEDLEAVRNVTPLLPAGDTALDPSPDDGHHGTAVLGEMVGSNNGLGVKGISYGASVGLAPEWTVLLGSARANAILLAVYNGKPGDVILLEMQIEVCGYVKPEGSYDGLGPAEWDQDVFEATETAVGRGIVVVAAAGNGNVNLDDPKCENKFNKDIRDSGAIIVGAGGSGAGCDFGGLARHKLWFSTFGSRLDVHGWGECIWTTGSDGASDRNKWYIDDFSGTSGASPFVAAAVANIQGIAMKKFGKPLTPTQVRQLLTDSGLPQLGDTTERIGPLVNLRAAIDSMLMTSAPITSTTTPATTTTTSTTTPEPDYTWSPTTPETTAEVL